MRFIKITQLSQVEEIIATVHKVFPHLPKSGRRLLTECMPYISFGLAITLAIMVVLSLIVPIPQLKQLFPPNLLMLRAVGLLIAYILFLSFSPLSRWMKKGWYNLFYSSLIQLLISLVFLNIYILLIQVIVWYVLFEIKEEYS